MDLQALYDLKERLEHAAMAGTSLLQEDFRLKRAAEALAPLAAASPVFAKITSSTQSLLAAPAGDRGKALLDVLSLVNAVVYTQGTANVPGELTPWKPGSRTYVQAPCSQLQPLLTALGGTGSGRTSQVRTAWETHPEYFRDFRVLPYVIGALGDSSSELSELISQILRRQGTDVVPLLEAGFDRKGKREMVRRVQLIEALAGAQENDFYLSELEGAEKEVRSALIYALRHNEANAQKLVELCQTERGNGKKAAHWALAKLESATAWAYWNALAEKDIKQVVFYMTLSTTSQAGDLVAKALDQWLTGSQESAHTEMTAEMAGQLQTLLYALPGKAGAAICEIYHRMASLGTALDSASYLAPNGQKTAVRLKAAEGQREALPFSQVIPVILRRSILLNPAPELMELARELSSKHVRYRIPEIASALLSRPAEEAFLVAKPWLSAGGLAVKQRSQESTDGLAWALENISWSEDCGKLAFQLALTDPAAGRVLVTRPIREPLDPRWYLCLTAPGGDERTDAYLFSLMDPQDAALREQLGQYFYQRALVVANNVPYASWLKACQWTTCTGLLEAYCKHNHVSSWMFVDYLVLMPGSPEDKAAEAERVCHLIQKKKIPVNNWNPAQVEKWIATMLDQKITVQEGHPSGSIGKAESGDGK